MLDIGTRYLAVRFKQERAGAMKMHDWRLLSRGVDIHLHTFATPQTQQIPSQSNHSQRASHHGFCRMGYCTMEFGDTNRYGLHHWCIRHYGSLQIAGPRIPSSKTSGYQDGASHDGQVCNDLSDSRLCCQSGLQ